MDVDESYTDGPTHLRIYSAGDGWWIDGADDEGNYTFEVWTLKTFAECLANAERFIAETAKDGVVWKWTEQRPATRIRTVAV